MYIICIYYKIYFKILLSEMLRMEINVFLRISVEILILRIERFTLKAADHNSDRSIFILLTNQLFDILTTYFFNLRSLIGGRILYN